MYFEVIQNVVMSLYDNNTTLSSQNFIRISYDR